MILDTNKIEEKALANFKGGEKALNARMHVDENNKIIFGRLEPGASIGEHTHETNSEIIFFTSGKFKLISVADTILMQKHNRNNKIKISNRKDHLEFFIIYLLTIFKNLI